MLRRSPGLLFAAYTAALVLYFTRGLLSTDFAETGDVSYHLACEAEVARTIADGRNPLGPIGLNYGTPILEFYQPLLYLVNGAVSAVTHLDVLIVHNVMIVLLFLLTPFVSRYAYRMFGLPDLAAGIAALLAPLSVAGFGASFESFFGTGVINQLVGAVFFPLFLATFAHLLTHGTRPLGAAALFALAFLAHVMMAVYAAFTGALMFTLDKRDIRLIWKALAVFAATGALLVAFWVVPFVSLQNEHRPVPDLVALPFKADLQTALTPGQATRLLVSGRLLDDAREPQPGARQGDDRLVDGMNQFGSPLTRPPVVTVLVLLGFALCLLRLRVFAYRLLVAGFAFSFLLLMGPDDVAWMRYLPFASRIQFFRCTYLLEFFGFGLAGAGIEMIASFLYRLALGLARPWHITLAAFGIALAVAALAGHFALVYQLGRYHVRPAPVTRFESIVKQAESVRKGYPLSVLVNRSGAFARDRHDAAYLGYRGISYICNHWRLVGPVIARNVTERVLVPGQNLNVARRSGIGYYLVDGKRAAALGAIEDGRGAKDRPFQRISRGAGFHLVQDRRASFFWDAGSAVLTIATRPEWLYVSREWLTALSRAGDKTTPRTPVLLPEGRRVDAALLAPFDAAWILAPERLEPADVTALEAFARSSGEVLSVAAVPGLGSAKLLQTKDGAPTPPPARMAGEDAMVELRSAASAAGPFDLTVRAQRPTVLVMPEFAVEGWTAQVNGRSTPILSAGASMVSFAVPEGKSRVVLEWRTPPRDLVLTIVSATAWLAVLAGLAWGVVRRRRRKGSV